MIKLDIGNVLEKHAEKLVFGIAGLLSIWLLFIFVIGSPNSVEIGGRKYKPGDVDRFIKTQADQLSQKIAEPAVPRVYEDEHAKKLFSAKMACTIESVENFEILVPGRSEKVIEEDRIYAVPVVGVLDNVVAETIRGVAHVPVDEVGMDNPYSNAITEPGDIDFVTVQADLDIAALYFSFKQSFSLGRGLKSEWRDEELATPVFAAAQLQRRRNLEDGGWSEWEVIPRTKIDQFASKMNTPEKVEELKYDISMLKAQFKSLEFQRNVLQPEAYDFASANTAWLTPSFHKEYITLIEAQKKEEIRLEREQARERGATNTRTPAGRGGEGRAGTSSRTRSTSRGGGYGGAGGSSDRRSSSRQRTTFTRSRTTGAGGRGRDAMEGYGGGDYYDEMDDPRRNRPVRDVQDVITDNVKILINERTKLEEMREKLTFWAHDDTAEPGNTYQYRIRLGVFNPIAGKNWFQKQDESYKDQVLLWSEFSDVTEDVEITPMVHFFPTELSRKSDKGVNIQISKYYLGNWRMENFEVRPGEMIGREVDFKPKTSLENSEDYGRGDYGRGDYDEYAGGGMANAMPDKIDFATGALMVDVVRTDQWTGRSLARANIADVFFTSDGITMNHLPVKRNYWTNSMKDYHSEIEKAAGEEVVITTNRTKGGLLKMGAESRTIPDRRGGMDSRRDAYYDEGRGGRGGSPYNR